MLHGLIAAGLGDNEAIDAMQHAVRLAPGAALLGAPLAAGAACAEPVGRAALATAAGAACRPIASFAFHSAIRWRADTGS